MKTGKAPHHEYTHTKVGVLTRNISNTEKKAALPMANARRLLIPKIRACVEAARNEVKKIHIVDGRVSHCLLLEIFTKQGIGTEIVD